MKTQLAKHFVPTLAQQQPTQVKLVGYDDIALAEHVHPTLSTIRQPTGQAGRALVDLLFEAIAGQARRSIVLPASLIVRESSA